MSSKYDSKIPQILEELKTKSQTQVEKDMGLRPNFLSFMMPRWKKQGLIDKNYSPPHKQQRVNATLKDSPHVFVQGFTAGICGLCFRTADNAIHTILPIHSKSSITPLPNPTRLPVTPQDPRKEPVRLPPFDNTWPTEVKVEWMRAYTAVVSRAKTLPFKEELHEGRS